MLSAGIVDPAKVVRVALQDAASIAGLMVTTEAMVAEAPKKNAAPAMPAAAAGWAEWTIDCPISEDRARDTTPFHDLPRLVRRGGILPPRAAQRPLRRRVRANPLPEPRGRGRPVADRYSRRARVMAIRGALIEVLRRANTRCSKPAVAPRLHRTPQRNGSQSALQGLCAAKLRPGRRRGCSRPPPYPPARSRGCSRPSPRRLNRLL